MSGCLESTVMASRLTCPDSTNSYRQGVLVVNPIVAMIKRPQQQRRNRRLLRIDGEYSVHNEGFHSIGGIDQWVSILGHHSDILLVLIVHRGSGSLYYSLLSCLLSLD